jgi:hypothetical protein
MSDVLSKLICNALTNVLEPLTQFASEGQILPRDFPTLVEQAYVQAIDRAAQRMNEPMASVSAVSARTGISRARVREIRSNNPGPTSRKTRPSHMLRVLTAWRTVDAFLDDSGEPKTLPRRGRVSFDSLVKHEGGDLRPGSILKELQRTNAVRITSDRCIEMLTRPDIDLERRAQAIKDVGEFGSELLETLVHNVAHPDMPRYYRRVVGLHVKNDDVPRLIRDASSAANIWASEFQEAITDRSVTVTPGLNTQPATRLSGHCFISERPTTVSPNARKPDGKKPTARMKGPRKRQSNHRTMNNRTE